MNQTCRARLAALAHLIVAEIALGFRIASLEIGVVPLAVIVAGAAMMSYVFVVGVVFAIEVGRRPIRRPWLSHAAFLIATVFVILGTPVVLTIFGMLLSIYAVPPLLAALLFRSRPRELHPRRRAT